MADANDGIQIQRIAADQTQPLRMAVLRPGYPPAESEFAGDEDPDTAHFGAIQEGRIVGIASLYREAMPGAAAGDDADRAWRLRGMAVDRAVRGRGVGSALLDACLDHAQAHGAVWFWCNARTPAVAFYRVHGLDTVGEEFDIPTVGPHFMMRVHIDQTPG